MHVAGAFFSNVHVSESEWLFAAGQRRQTYKLATVHLYYSSMKALSFLALGFTLYALASQERAGVVYLEVGHPRRSAGQARRKPGEPVTSFN